MWNFRRYGFRLALGPFDSTKEYFYQVSSALLEDGDRALLEDEWKFVKHLPMLFVSRPIHWRLNYGSGVCMSRALGCCVLEKTVWVSAISNTSPYGEMGGLEKARKMIIILRNLCGITSWNRWKPLVFAFLAQRDWNQGWEWSYLCE